MGVTDLRRRDGSIAIQLCPARWDPDTVPFTDNFKTLILLLEKLIEDEENQIHGFTILNNQIDVPFSTIFRLSQTEQIRKGVFTELLQDSFPGRFKGMHLVNQAWYISLVLGVIRPFMKQKMRERDFSFTESITKRSMSTLTPISSHLVSEGWGEISKLIVS